MIQTDELKRCCLHLTVFGPTPLDRRLADINEEALELLNYTDEANLKEEVGDLLCSLHCLAAEKNWVVEDLIKDTLEKIKKRYSSGHYHKTGEARGV